MRAPELVSPLSSTTFSRAGVSARAPAVDSKTQPAHAETSAARIQPDMG